MLTILQKLNAASLITFATAILSALTTMGITVPHPSVIVQGAGVVGMLAASLFEVWNQKPHTEAQAIHSLVQAVNANATTEQKTALVAAYQGYVAPTAPTIPAATVTPLPPTMTALRPAVQPNQNANLG